MTIRTAVAAAALLLSAATGAAAQGAVGMPFHGGDNQIHSYTFRSGSDGAYSAHVHGAVIARQIRSADANTAVALFGGGGVGVNRDETDVENINLRGGVSLSRRIAAIDPRLSLAAVVGGEIFLTEDGSDRMKRWGNVRVPATIGLGYDVPLGAVTLTPYASSTLAWFREDEWQDETRVATRRDRDVSAEAGATLQWKALAIGAGYSRWEHGFDPDGRLKMTLGLSF